MSIKNGTTLTTDALSYLVGLIKDISGLDTKLIDNINLKDNGTFSSTKIDLLLRTLKEECNEYSENLCSNLSRLELKLVTSETEITQSNILYLFKPDGQTSYNQYVVIDGNKVLLGTCDVSMTDYYTITQVDNKFVLKTDYNDLVNTVNTINDTIGTETLTTTSKTVIGAINELDSKSTIETLTKAEHEQKVADGTIDNDIYYIINDDSENLDLNQFNIKTYTSVEQLGLTAPVTTGELFNAMPDNSYCEINSADSTTNIVISDVPIPYGLLTIRKLNNARFDIQFKYSLYGSIVGNDLYIGNLQGNDGSGLTWSRVCTTKVDDIAPTEITLDETKFTKLGSSNYIKYCVVNGMCIIQIDGIGLVNTGNYTISTSVPKPLLTKARNILQAEANTTVPTKPVYIQVVDNTLSIYSQNSLGHFWGDLVYPVATE